MLLLSSFFVRKKHAMSEQLLAMLQPLSSFVVKEASNEIIIFVSIRMKRLLQTLKCVN